MPFFEAVGILVSIMLGSTYFNNSCCPRFICLCVSYYFSSSVKSVPSGVLPCLEEDLLAVQKWQLHSHGCIYLIKWYQEEQVHQVQEKEK